MLYERKVGVFVPSQWIKRFAICVVDFMLLQCSSSPSAVWIWDPVSVKRGSCCSPVPYCYVIWPSDGEDGFKRRIQQPEVRQNP